MEKKRNSGMLRMGENEIRGKDKELMSQGFIDHVNVTESHKNPHDPLHHSDTLTEIKGSYSH